MKKLLLLAALLVAAASPTRAAVTIAGTVTSSSAVDTNTLTFAWNNSASANYLVVGVGSIPDTVTGVTYNGTAMTSLGSVSDSNPLRYSLWGLANPASGSHDVVVSLSGGTGEAVGAGAIGFAGVCTSAPTGTFASNTSTGSTISQSVSSMTGAIVVGGVYSAYDPTVTGTNQTQRWEVVPSVAYVAGSTQTGASSVTFSYSLATAYTAVLGAISVNPTYDLTVSKAGGGTGTVTSSPSGINCGADCTEAYAPSTVVTLSQSAAGGSHFTSWGGDCSGSGSCQVTMSAAKSVTATFALDSTYTLTVSKAGTGTGTVTSSPSGINCGGDCTEDYASGDVTLSQSTSDTWAGWSGDCSGTGSCVVTMSAARSVTATFNAAAPTVDGHPDIKVCDRLQSTLCSAVGVAFGFEEDTDRTRYDSTAGVVALEPNGYNVARAAGKLGSYAVDFAGNENSHLRVPGLPSIGPGYWTLTAWVYPDALGSAGQVQTLLANDYKSQGGTHVYLENVGGALKLKVSVTNSETNAVIIATSGTNLTTGAWNFIAVGASQWPTEYGQANLFAQVGNSTKGTASLTYSVRGANYESYLGARVMQPTGFRTPFDGRLDALYIFGSALNAAQLTNLYNSGNGKTFPFVD